MSSLPASDGQARGRGQRSRWMRPWVSRRTLIIFWAMWLPIVGFVLVTPRLGGYRITTPHPGQPALRLSLVNGSSHDVALVIAGEKGGEHDVEWLGDTSHGTVERARPGQRLTFSVVASSFAGPVVHGEGDIMVPHEGIARIFIADDGSGTVVAADGDEAQRWLDLEAPPGSPDGAAAAELRPVGARVVNESSHRLHATFHAQDGALFEQVFHGRSTSLSMPRPLIPGEILHATWEVAAPVTDGGTPLRVEAPGDLSLQVRVFPDGRWEIGEPSLLGLLRLKLSMFAAVFTGE